MQQTLKRYLLKLIDRDIIDLNNALRFLRAHPEVSREKRIALLERKLATAKRHQKKIVES